MKSVERVTRHVSLGAGIKRIVPLLFAVAMMAAVIAARAQTSPPNDVKQAPQSAKDLRGASPYAEVENEPAPKLIVDPPLPDLLDQGVVWIQWRVENVHIVPVFGKDAVNITPRVGHLHVQVDDLPWWWADPSNVNTIDMAGMPPGPHKVKISLVNADHQVFPGQSKTVAFTIPKRTSHSHQGHGGFAGHPERPNPRERE